MSNNLTHSTAEDADNKVSHDLMSVQTVTGPDVKKKKASPVRPGASVAHAPLYSCSYGPCRLECQKYLTREDPEANTHIQREKEQQQGMNETTGNTATTVVLQWEQCFP